MRFASHGILSFLAILVLAAPTTADVVVDSEEGIRAGVLELGSPAECCPPEGCSGIFEVANSGSETLRMVTFAASDLDSKNDSIDASAVSFTPPLLPKIGPRDRQAILVELAPPTGVIAGTFEGEVTIADASGAFRVELPVIAHVCGVEPRAALELVAVDGLRGDDGCTSSELRGTYRVVNVGNVTLTDVRPSLDGLPPGVSAAITPSVVSLEAGAQATFAVSVVPPSDLEPATYAATLSAADTATGVAATVAVSFERCDPAVPALRLRPAADGGDGYALLAESCSDADLYRMDVEVENIGDVALSDVRLFLTELPAVVTASVVPGKVALAVGQVARFSLEVRGASELPIGLHRGRLAVWDPPTGAADESVATLERCQADEPEDPEDPETPIGRSMLTVNHRASRSAVRVGEVVTISIDVENIGSGVARDLVIEDALPAGVVYVAGRTVLDGAQWDEPSHPSRCRWNVPDLAAGERLRLRFQVAVSSSARRGRRTANAFVHGQQIEVGPVPLNLEVTRHSLRPFGEIRGRVSYRDRTGAADVRVLLDHDREVRSDEEGRYRFDGVLGGEHLVYLDDRSLADGVRLTSEPSELVRLFDGTVETVDFALARRPRLGLSVARVTGH